MPNKKYKLKHNQTEFPDRPKIEVTVISKKVVPPSLNETEVYPRFSDERKRMAETKPPLVPSTRMNLALICFFGCLFTYTMRTNMSFAIVCMVNETAVAASANTSILDAVASAPISQCAKSSSGESSGPMVEGEFAWDQDTTSSILSAFFWGYLGSQVLGGYLASTYGGKRVVLVTILGSSLLTLLNPIAARTSVYLLIALRALIGFLQGATFPAMHTMWSVWGPPMEVTVLTGITYAGAQIGNVLVLPLSGFLCQYGFDGGWPSIFYLLGIGGVLWCAVWMYMTSDRPASHPRISAEEKDYIVREVEASMGKQTGKPPKTPWVKILTSRAVWACWAGHFAGDWGAYTMLVALPSFLKDVLGLDLKSLGVLAAIPYIAYFIAINVGSVIADGVRAHGILSTLNTRRAAMLVALIGQAIFLVAAGYCGCGQDALVIAFVTAGMAISGLQYSGFVVNYLDIAPPFSGTIMGAGNTLSSLAGIISPKVVSILVVNKTKEEWQLVLWVTFAVLTFGALFFSLFCSGEVQPWAKAVEDDSSKGHELAPLRDSAEQEKAEA